MKDACFLAPYSCPYSYSRLPHPHPWCNIFSYCKGVFFSFFRLARIHPISTRYMDLILFRLLWFLFHGLGLLGWEGAGMVVESRG